MSENIEIYTHSVPEDTFVDVAGTRGVHTGKPKRIRIFGQADAIPSGALTEREAPTYDEELTPDKVIERVTAEAPSRATIFNTSDA